MYSVPLNRENIWQCRCDYPLNEALRKSQDRLLIQAILKQSAPNEMGSALSIALERGEQPIIDLLVKLKAVNYSWVIRSLNSGNYSKEPNLLPIMKAREKLFLEAVSCIVKGSSSVKSLDEFLDRSSLKVRDMVKGTAFKIACKKKHLDLMAYLVNAEPNPSSSLGQDIQQVFKDLCQKWDVDSIKYLIARTHIATSSLHDCFKDSLNTITDLTKKATLLKVLTQYTTYYRYLTARHWHKEYQNRIENAKKEGCSLNINFQDPRNGQTLLMGALAQLQKYDYDKYKFMYGDYKAYIKYLLSDKDVDVKREDHNGNSAIHLAAEILDPDIVTWITQKNSRLCIENEIGQSPLMVVLNKGFSLFHSDATDKSQDLENVKKMVKLLIDRDPDLVTHRFQKLLGYKGRTVLDSLEPLKYEKELDRKLFATDLIALMERSQTKRKLRRGGVVIAVLVCLTLIAKIFYHVSASQDGSPGSETEALL